MKKKDISNFRSKSINEITKLVNEKRIESTKSWAEVKAGKEKT
jgi:hypothetical protein